MKEVEVVDLTDDSPDPTPAQEPPVEEAGQGVSRVVLFDPAVL
jgi:hypothetical protein